MLVWWLSDGILLVLVCTVKLSLYVLTRIEAFAFGDGDSSNVFIGNNHFANDGLPSRSNPTNSQAFWFFQVFPLQIDLKFLFIWTDFIHLILSKQFCFAATSATIVSGAAAERLKWQAYIIWVFVYSLWIYPVVVHCKFVLLFVFSRLKTVLWFSLSSKGVWSKDGWMNPGGHNAVWGVGTMDYAGSSQFLPLFKK